MSATHGAMCNVLRFRCGGCGRHRSYCLSHQEPTRANLCQCNRSIGYIREERERSPMEVPDTEAADEITRLRTENERLQDDSAYNEVCDEVIRLRARVEELEERVRSALDKTYAYQAPPHGGTGFGLGFVDGYKMASDRALRALTDQGKEDDG